MDNGITDQDAPRPESRSLDSHAIHALSNHLGVILGFIELVLEDTPEGDPRRADLLEIRQAATTASTLLAAATGTR